MRAGAASVPDRQAMRLPPSLLPAAEAGPAPADTAACAFCQARLWGMCGAAPGRPEVLRRLAALAERSQLAAGETLWLEGEPSDHMVVLGFGTLRLVKSLPDGRRQVTGFALAGDLVGLADAASHTASVEAVTAAGICRFPRAGLALLMAEIPELGRHFTAALAGALAAAQEQMALLGRKTAVERVCSFLLALSQRAARRGLSSNPVWLPMNRSDIADHLGLTVETVSRTLTRLKDQGVIALPDSQRIRLLRPDDAASIAAGR